MLLGSDKLPELEHGWLHVEEIAREFGIVCLRRGGDACREIIASDPSLRALSPNIRVLETPPETRFLSSTAVRSQVRQIMEMKAALHGAVPEEIYAPLWSKETQAAHGTKEKR